jgi:subtilisin family serine protease
MVRLVALIILAVILSPHGNAGAEKQGNVLVFQGATANGDAFENKLDPGLRFLSRKYEEVSNDQSTTGLANREALHDGSLYFSLRRASAGGVSEVPILIRIAQPASTLELEREGLTVTAVAGDVVAGYLPVTSIYSIAALPGVVSMQAAGRSFPCLDSSRVETRVNQAHFGGGGLDMPYKGNGVVVGMVDSGIDWAHPDFSLDTGNTRIQFLYDYAVLPNGREWTKQQIDQNQCTEIDGQGSGGHGTHVAGIAAGNGRRNPAFVGMAPESPLIVVKGIRDQNSNGGFLDNDVVAGVQYVFNKSRTLGMPAAVNLSLGGHYGPHDGTGLYEQALSNLVKPGCIIIAAAGNEGQRAMHVSYPVEGNNYQTALESFWDLSNLGSVAAADMWYPPTTSISVGVAVYTPGVYNSPIALTNAVGPGQSISNLVLRDGANNPLGKVTIDALTASDPNNGHRRVVVVIETDGMYPVSSFVWSVYTFGSGTFDMWAVAGGDFPPEPGLPSYTRQGDNNKTVGMPATARKVVCVGSYVSKTRWLDVDNILQFQTGATFGQISTFSSRGPSRDARMKPDFVAPGEAVISALSSAATPARSNIALGGGLQKLEGTSMAAPHVTGIVALLLQRNRYLTYENVVSLISSTATQVGVPGNTHGAGKVNALAALLATPPGVDCATLARTTGVDCDGNRIVRYELLDAHPNPFNPSTTISFGLANAEHADLAVYDILGRRVTTLVNGMTTEGQRNIAWDGTSDTGVHVASGVYFVRLVTPGFHASRRLVMLK